jgi:hypothetical protein
MSLIIYFNFSIDVEDCTLLKLYSLSKASPHLTLQDTSAYLSETLLYIMFQLLSLIKMEKSDQHIAVCCVFIIASATIGGCFPDIRQVNVILS